MLLLLSLLILSGSFVLLNLSLFVAVRDQTNLAIAFLTLAGVYAAAGLVLLFASRRVGKR